MRGDRLLEELELVIRSYQCLLLNLLGNRVHFLKRSRIRRHGLLLNRWVRISCVPHASIRDPNRGPFDQSQPREARNLGGLMDLKQYFKVDQTFTALCCPFRFPCSSFASLNALPSRERP